MSRFRQLFSQKPVIGMLHLRPLPGAPRSTTSTTMSSVMDAMLADADALVHGGAAALMMENFGDVPFAPGRVDAATVAQMTALAAEVKRKHRVPLGINVLRNDGESALGIAAAVGAEFIRVNVLSGARVTDQGVIQGIAYDLLRLRKMLAADHILILADVDVKHSAPLAARPLADEVEDTLKRGLADAVIVSGRGTGAAADPQQLAAAKEAAKGGAVLVGSGVNGATLPTLLPHADGFIVGTAFKAGGDPMVPVQKAKVEALLRTLHDLVR